MYLKKMHCISFSGMIRGERREIMQGNRKKVSSFIAAILLIAVASGIGWLFQIWNFPETNIVIVYILSVVLTARFTEGYVYGIMASIIATCAFNMFFTSPYFTLSVNNPTYLITFAIMTITSVITSTLTAKVKQNAREAQEKEAAARALYHLTNRLTNAESMQETIEIAEKAMEKVIGEKVSCICFEGERQRTEKEPEVEEWQIRGKKSVLGLVRISGKTAETLSESKKKILRSMIESTAFAMDRFRSEAERLKVSEEVAQERYRGNMLRAISHDLRTPLSGIMGTSEILMGMAEKQDERYVLAENIYKDAAWLHALVENILNLTRMQDGRLVLEKQMEAVEEVIEMAVTAIGKRAPERDIAVEIPDEVLLVPMDAKLIGQVLINLLDNAVKHTTVEEEICLTVSVNEKTKEAVFSVADEGCGIAREDLPNIFKMFYTTSQKGADTDRGMGLGLAICKSIITAHGGRIWAENRSDRTGAQFTFTLPMEEER